METMMARASRLKVFRTAIGFHDAYIAAPSQKAALEAWGTDHNLFGRGEAELVVDEALTAEPLAHPGQVIRRLRGTSEEQFAALGSARSGPKPGNAKGVSSPKKRHPRPDRAALDRADEALAEAEERHEREREALTREEKRLAARRRVLQDKNDAELIALRRDRASADDAYQSELEAWRAED
jgi:hypothetical protein